MFNLFKNTIKTIKSNSECYRLLKRFISAKFLILISTTLLINASNTLLIFKIFTILLLLETILLFCYTNSSPFKSFILLFVISFCSQLFGILLIYSISFIPNILQLAFAFLILISVFYLLHKTNIIYILLEKNARNNIICFCFCTALITIIYKITLSIIIPFFPEIQIFNTVSYPIQTSCEILGATAGMSGVIGSNILHNPPKPQTILIFCMGNSGSRGIGALGSAANNLGHMSPPGGGKPIKYTDGFIKEFRQQIGIYSFKDRELIKSISNKRDPLKHLIAINDEKTVATTLTTNPDNSTHISKETVYPRKDKKQQYMYNEPYNINKDFVNNEMKQTTQEKQYGEKYKEKLESKQKQIINKTKPKESLNTRYEEAKNKYIKK